MAGTGGALVDLGKAKKAARAAAFARRKIATGDTHAMCQVLKSKILELPGNIVAGYWPIRTEADPREAMADLSRTKGIVLPVVDGAGLPLSFRSWSPDAEMIEGAFGAAIPKNLEGEDPDPRRV